MNKLKSILLAGIIMVSGGAMAASSTYQDNILSCNTKDGSLQVDDSNRVISFLNGNETRLRITGIRDVLVTRLENMEFGDDPVNIVYSAPNGKSTYLTAFIDRTNKKRPYKVFGKYTFEGKHFITQNNCKIIKVD